ERERCPGAGRRCIVSIADALPPLAEALAFEDMAAIEDMLEAAAACQRGEMPWHVAARGGTLRDWRGEPLPSYSRHVAYRVTARTDPRWQALGALIDTIVRMNGYRATPFGLFTDGEIRVHDAGFDRSAL